MPFAIGPKIHNVIPAPLKQLVEEFFSGADWRGLYLSGGTCLAEYYFGHRISVDMDLFTADAALFAQTERFLKDPRSFASGRMEEVRTTPQLSQYLFHPKDGSEPIKVDLMLEFAPHRKDPIGVGKVWVDSPEDLLANKLGCIVQRNEIKNYLDLYHLIPASHLTARELAQEALSKEGGFDPLIAAQQMEFLFGSPAPDPAVLGKTDWRDLQLFFRKLQKEFRELIRPRA